MMLQMQFHETMQWDPLRLPISEVCIRQSNETCYQPLNPQGFAKESIVLTIFVPPCPPHPEQSCKAPGTHRKKKSCFHSKVGCVSSMFGWQSCNVKKCGITIGVHIMFVGSVESFMMLHFFSVGVAVMDLHLFNALMATDQDQHENICAQIVMRNVSWCCISRVLTAVMVYKKNGLFY